MHTHQWTVRPTWLRKQQQEVGHCKAPHCFWASFWHSVMHLSGFVPHSAEASPTSTQSIGSVTGLTSVIVSCTDLETPGGTLQTNNPCVRFSCTSPFLRSPCGEIGCSSQTDRAIIEIQSLGIQAMWSSHSNLHFITLLAVVSTFLIAPRSAPRWCAAPTAVWRCMMWTQE